MITRQLLGISLALVMLVGLSPLGFSEPLRVQLEQGIETDQLQCNNPNHVLVQRTNGNVACVTEKNAEKTGWIIIKQSITESNTEEVTSEELEFLKTETIQPIEISDTRITIEQPLLDMTEPMGYTVEPTRYPQAWTSLTYPEEFILGEPFEIEYTWTFLKTFSERDGDVYPGDLDFDEYPWAQTWKSYDEWEDGNDLIVWQEMRKTDGIDGLFVSISGDDRLKVLTQEFVHHDWAADNLLYGTYYQEITQVIGQLDYERHHPWNLQQNTATIKLQIDEIVEPSENKNRYIFEIGQNENYKLYLHFNDGKGYISPNYIKWFATGVSQMSSAQTGIPNQYPCNYTNEMWDARSYEKQLWDQIYFDPTHCDGKSDYVAPEDRPKTVYRTIEEQLEYSTLGTKDWLERNNITENIRDYLENTLHIIPDEVKHFFEKYPELEFQSFLSNPFSFLPNMPSAYAIHGNDHIVQAHGKFLVDDIYGNPKSPIGIDVCLYDKQGDGNYVVLYDGAVKSCKVMTSITGDYSIRAENTISGELVVGIVSENEIIKITNYNLDSQGIDTVHGDGDVYVAYSPDWGFSSVPNNADQIVSLPDVTINRSSDFLGYILLLNKYLMLMIM